MLLQEITSILERSCSSFLLSMMKRMRTMISKITLLLLCCSIISSKASKSDCDSYAPEGGNFSVSAGQQVKKTQKLRWTHNGVRILDRRQSKTDKPGDFNIGNARDIDENGSLKLTNLTKNKAGLYEPEAYDNDGKALPNLKNTRLCVVEPVPEPKVAFQCDKGKDKIELTCTTAKGVQGVQFEWLQDNKLLSQKTKVLTQDVKTLGKGSFTCRISKNLISATSKGVQPTCPTNNFIFPEKIMGVSVWIFVGCGGGIVLLLIIVTILCCIRARKKQSRLSKDEEELRLGWTNPQQEQREFHQHSHPPHHRHQHQHQHHHHQLQQQHPAGHTGPRQNRTKRPRAPDPTNGRPQPSPRAAPQAPKPADGDEEQPPPLPQPRKKVPKTPRM